MEDVIFEKGTLIHYKGIPFELKTETTMLGLEKNKALADQFADRKICEASAGASLGDAD